MPRRGGPNYRLGDLSTQLAVAAAVDGVRELSLLDRWTYALCPVDERDEGIARLADWTWGTRWARRRRRHGPGRLPPAERAGQDALQLAERAHRRLVAWRWMALRFPETYRDLDGALAESRRLNEWIGAVPAARPPGRVFGAAADAEAAGAGEGRGRRERSGAAARPPGKGRRTGRRRHAGAGRPV